MSIQKVVYSQGVDEFSVAANGCVSVFTVGENYAQVFKQTTYPNYPASWELIGTVSNDTKTFSFSEASLVRITAGADPVYYSIGVSAPMPAVLATKPVVNAHTYFNDFDTYVAGDWTVTTVGAGATQALGNLDGGVLVLTNDAADDDRTFLQKKGESFLFQAGRELWFEARFKVSDATQSDIVLGLQITDTSPLDVTDGVFFIKADGSAAIGLRVEKNNTGTDTASVATLADDTFVTLGFYYDGIGRIDTFVNGVFSKSSVTTNLVDDEELTVSFGIQNGEAAAKVMTIDYISVTKQR